MTGSGEVTTNSTVDEISGKLQFSDVHDKLMHAVLEGDQEAIDNGKLISDAINQGLSSFTPDLMYENLVKNFNLAQQIYGMSVLRELTGFTDNELERNLHLPEFRRELSERIRERLTRMQKDKLLDTKNAFTERALGLASLVMYVEELDRLKPYGFGERVHKHSAAFGDKDAVRSWRHDPYRDVSVHKTIRVAVRRNHRKLVAADLRAFEHVRRGQIYLIYALDASGSMRGTKIESCKKAGIALAYRALEARDLVGIIVFGREIKRAVPPTQNFSQLLREIVSIRAQSETDISQTIRKAVEMFPTTEVTRHLVLITDALPTVGDKPERDTLEAASLAKTHGVTISLVGIALDERGKELARKIVELGEGRLYTLKNTDNVDQIVLEDYQRLQEL